MPDAQGVPGRPPSASWHLRGVKLGSEAAGCAMRRERSRSQGGGEEERLQRLVDERQEARRARDYDEADRLRENLRGMGVEVNDSELSWKGPGGLGGLIRNGATMGTTRREGDWDCPNCGSLNFGYRDLCFKCNTQKTQDRGGGGRGDYMGRDDGRDRVDDRRGRYEEDRRGFRDDRYERGPDRMAETATIVAAGTAMTLVTTGAWTVAWTVAMTGATIGSLTVAMTASTAAAATTGTAMSDLTVEATTTAATMTAGILHPCPRATARATMAVVATRVAAVGASEASWPQTGLQLRAATGPNRFFPVLRRKLDWQCSQRGGSLL
eukprot:CAMPEP_0197901832 /NCGR_PEP_ID=MMETSP1439-20131203/52011_1 /TAXON_ID=66791 /ORGANISM="Gonyaulax spinifera, Strain CCMP409" /LENGTH=323 /DNA_ID=CAMNT_0043522817 /DNA_START=3 /DNA_END=972 /DNA_ORIENTATION=+